MADALGGRPGLVAGVEEQRTAVLVAAPVAGSARGRACSPASVAVRVRSALVDAVAADLVRTRSSAVRAGTVIRSGPRLQHELGRDARRSNRKPAGRCSRCPQRGRDLVAAQPRPEGQLGRRPVDEHGVGVARAQRQDAEVVPVERPGCRRVDAGQDGDELAGAEQPFDRAARAPGGRGAASDPRGPRSRAPRPAACARTIRSERCCPRCCPIGAVVSSPRRTRPAEPVHVAPQDLALQRTSTQPREQPRQSPYAVATCQVVVPGSGPSSAMETDAPSAAEEAEGRVEHLAPALVAGPGREAERVAEVVEVDGHVPRRVRRWALAGRGDRSTLR